MKLDSLNKDCEYILQELDNFVRLHPDMKDKEVAVAYSAAQLFQDKLKEANLDHLQKGMIVSDIIAALLELNKEEVALYRERRKASMEQKHSTIH